MLSTDSALISTLCISTLFILLLGDSKGTEALNPETQSNKVQLIQTPYFRGMAADGTYQDFYEMPNQYDLGWKRAPSAGFYGMRGKKVPSPNNFYGMRGKKGPIGFLGMRGKKLDPSGLGDRWDSKEVLLGAGSDEDKPNAARNPAEKQQGSSSPGLPFSSPWDKRVPQGFMGLRGKRELDSTTKELRPLENLR